MVTYLKNLLTRSDNTNNVESIFIDIPLAGKYHVVVIGSSVTFLKQDFDLVCSGGFG